jgi:hypothetical protein
VHALALVLLAAIATSCSLGGGGGDDAASSTTAAATTNAAPAAATDPCATFRGSDAPRVSVGPTAPGQLIGAVAGALGCLDRVEFTFNSLGDGTLRGAGLAPGYDVRYVDPPFTDAGTPISIPGDAFLQVTMKPASSYDTSDPAHPKPTYLGNLRLRWSEHNHLQVVQRLEDVGDSVLWIISLDGRRPFAVDAARDPTRITIWIG